MAEADGGYTSGRRRAGLRLTFRGGLPESVWGRVATGAALLTMAAAVFAGCALAQRLMLRDQRFVITSPGNIAIIGDHHLTRAQILSAMGGLAGRNVFSVSLARERDALEQMPWVEHATVMRLLPDRLRISVIERTPVAFARNGGHIALVDANGVLLDMTAGEHYSFPVVTGISRSDPDAVRASRMRVFADFTAALDAGGERITSRLSEIDLSNPEDVRALIPENGSDVLVHFGDSEYLERYRRFEKLLPEWRAQYPDLSGADMRYEQQVVLEMKRGAGAATTSDTLPATSPGATHALKTGEHTPTPAAKPSARTGSTPGPHGARGAAVNRKSAPPKAVHHSAVQR